MLLPTLRSLRALESNCHCYNTKYRSSIRLETYLYLYTEKHALLEASMEGIRDGVILYYNTYRALHVVLRSTRWEFQRLFTVRDAA
jgi:hypothetical protein